MTEIPGFQKFMLPLLQFAADEKEHSTNEALDYIAKEFGLTEEQQNEMLPSGNQKIFSNRVFWAKSYLKMAGLIENTKRAHFKITERGLSTLNENLDEINIRYLKKFPDYLELSESWRKGSSGSEKEEEVSIPQTPEELLENSYQDIRKSLAQDILSKIKSCSPSFFEKTVVELLVKMGYGGSRVDAGKAIGKSGDEGIDGIIKEDKLGLDIIYIQAKRWENVVGRPEIQKFVGALAGQGAKKGIFITTSRFTNEAKEYIPRNETKIVLIDGEQLANLLIDNDLGVSKQVVYEIKKIDTDYFEEE
ncbi:MAG TPA: restriction endonuclease [Ignavibacteriaceae bacterium]|nr:restriction endonuclease [Ignavibacteriaceae bacterium]